MYYHQINRISEEPIYITPDQAKQINHQIKDKAGFVFLPGDITIATSSIKSIEQTNKPLISNQNQLESGEAKNPGVQLTSDGSVKAIWAKKQVPTRLYYSYYMKSPGYIKLDESGSDTIIAFTRAVASEPLPFDIQECLPAESERLERMLARR